jgi:L-ascorbate metabolism protein UlaG (beta-lactamase superfamily)
MRTALKWIGTVLLWTVVVLCLAVTLIPLFLDRVYYQGPPSDHFDGERFFNPGFPPYGAGGPQRFAARWIGGGGGERAQWPEQVPVTPGYPPAQATACPPARGAIVENWRRCTDRVDPNLMVATWIGHSTVLIQAGGLNILTDPLWSERASPFSFIGPKRVRAPGIRFDDLPKIDLVLISHNHYDHMDLPTLKALWARDKPLIVTSLGNNTILASEGIRSVALDWGDDTGILGPNCTADRWPDCEARATIIVERNHHWSSRWGTDRNRALWSAFSVKTPAGNIFFGGDTGWGDGSWVREAARNGPFRLAILPIGAYEPRDFMKTNHINPEEAVRIFEALRPTRALGVHWGTVQLTFEPIHAPPRDLAAALRKRRVPPGRFLVTEVGRPITIPR